MSKCKKISIVMAVLVAIAISAVREHNIRGSSLWFGEVPTADLSVDMRGKTVVVTGANTGIGQQSAAALKAMGARVIMACRSVSRGEAAKKWVNEFADDLQLTRQAHGGGSVQVRQLDLASFDSIEQFVQALVDDSVHVDVLLNNAGVMNENDYETADGLPVVTGVNHFGVFRLTVEMLNKGVIAKNSGARIVVVSSMLHANGVGQIDTNDLLLRDRQGQLEAMGVYSASKLLNVLFAQSLAERLAGVGITVNSLHPGYIATQLSRDITGVMALGGALASKLVAMDSWQGAQNSIHLATAPELANVSGQYFAHFEAEQPSLPAEPEQFRAILWSQSAQLTGVDLTIQ